MALASKKNSAIHDKTGSDLATIKTQFDNAKHLELIDFPGEAALIYQMELMQQDIDELRRYIVALAPSEKPLPTISTASHTVDFTVTNSRGAYTLVTTVVDNSSGKAVTKTASTTLR